MADANPTAQMEAFIIEERGDLWRDLIHAITFSINGEWSIRCDNLGARIKDATELVGPQPWEEISTPFVFGRYREVCERIGVECDYPTMSEERRARELYRKAHGEEL